MVNTFINIIPIKTLNEQGVSMKIIYWYDERRESAFRRIQAIIRDKGGK
jgi:hypothetical protein